MSPDIHWHIGDDAERETIVVASSPRRSRRSWIAVLIVVMLGAGLGMAYRSIPEPTPRPTPIPSPTIEPTPTPTPTPSDLPAKLFAAIDREAQALADGDIETVIVLHELQDAQMAEWQRRNFVAWGRPKNDSPMYAIIDFNLRTLTNVYARADVRQFRNGRYFRETRFYRWEKDRWLRSEFDPFLYEHRKETHDTPHFHTSYHVEDRDLAQAIVQALEETYPQVCRDLGCTEAAATLTFTLRLEGDPSNGLWLSGDARELVFTAPSLTGIFEDKPLDRNNLILLITVATVQRVYYDTASQPQWRGYYDAASRWGVYYNLASQWHGDTDGHIIFNAIINWAMQQMAGEPNRIGLFTTDLEQQDLVPLSQLWGKAYVYDQNNQVQPRVDRNIIYPEGGLVIRFIEQEYGAAAMPKLLKALGTARSFENLIEKSLGIPFAEFDQKWQAWVKTNLATR